MIVYESFYRQWLRDNGVGDNDRVASSPASYISYLNSVSSLLGQDISPTLLNSEEGVQEVLERIDGMRARNTIRNYGSAMRQYVAMVQAGAIP